MTRIYLARHAESIANKERIFAGHFDVELSPKGHRQAQALADYIAQYFPVDVIYASDLRRTMSTALPISEKTGVPVIPDMGLREIYAGEWEGMTYDQILCEYAEDYRVMSEDFPRSCCTGGESTAELYERISAAVMRILAENEGKNIMIVTHAGPIRVFTAYALGFAADCTDRVKYSANTGFSVFTYKDNKFAPEKLGSLDHFIKCPEILPETDIDCYEFQFNCIFERN